MTVDTPSDLPLDGMTVVDLSRFLSGPYCTMVLAELGANVIKVEQPGSGDDSRALGPLVNGESYPFAMVNRSKRSVSLDLKSPAGKEALIRLVREADIVVENFRPGVVDRLGIGYADISALNPGLVYCSISGFGQTGPQRSRPGYDIMAQGVAGLMRMTGQEDGRPAKVGIAINDIAAGATAAQAVLAAQLLKLRTGRGQYIDISLVEAGLAWTLWEAGAWFGSGEVPQPTGTRHRRSSPYQAYRTKDGFVTIGANNERQWRTLVTQVLEADALLDDPRFRTLADRIERVDELEEEIESITRLRTTDEWIEALDLAGVPGGPVLTYDQSFEHPQVRSRELVVEMDHPLMGPVKTVGPGAKFSGFDYTVRYPAPWLGQHTAEILGDAGYSAAEIDHLFVNGIAYDSQRTQAG